MLFFPDYALAQIMNQHMLWLRNKKYNFKLVSIASIGLVPAPHLQDAVEVAAHNAGRTDQGAVTDEEGQGQGTGEEDSEKAILFVFSFHLRENVYWYWRKVFFRLKIVKMG